MLHALLSTGGRRYTCLWPEIVSCSFWLCSRCNMMLERSIHQCTFISFLRMYVHARPVGLPLSSWHSEPPPPPHSEMLCAYVIRFWADGFSSFFFCFFWMMHKLDASRALPPNSEQSRGVLLALCAFVLMRGCGDRCQMIEPMPFGSSMNNCCIKS